MKKVKDELRPAYKRSDFAKLERGKFHAGAASGSTLVLLEPDIAKAFPSSEAVNEALGGLLALAKQTAKASRKSSAGRKA
jgi:hypothetical protein